MYAAPKNVVQILIRSTNNKQAKSKKHKRQKRTSSSVGVATWQIELYLIFGSNGQRPNDKTKQSVSQPTNGNWQLATETGNRYRQQANAKTKAKENAKHSQALIIASWRSYRLSVIDSIECQLN